MMSTTIEIRYHHEPGAIPTALPPVSGPHRGQTVLVHGAPLDEADSAAILVHGRGADAGGILGLAAELPREGMAYLAPQAAGRTWYPAAFSAPQEVNEPFLSSALSTLGQVVRHLGETGIPTERTLLLGFSQGACLTLEWLARHPRRFGAVAALTGSLIGPPPGGEGYRGDLAGTPLFLGSGDPDPHVPFERVRESAEVLEGLGGEVRLERYPGRPHTISPAEIDAVRELLQRI